MPAVLRSDDLATVARYVLNGGFWSYKFNVERCRSLSLEFRP